MKKRKFLLAQLCILLFCNVAMAAPMPVSYKKSSGSSTSGKTTVSVKKGDTLYSISRRFDISVRYLIDANKLKPPYTLEVGDKIIIPRENFHKVQKNDTLYSISRKYGVDLSQLAKANNLKKPYALLLGQKLKIPYQNFEPESPKQVTKTAKTINKETKAPVKTIETAKAHSYSDSKRNITKYDLEKNIKYVDKLKGPVRFNWPVKGKVISKFGGKGEGIFNDGINISAPEGREIRAAADGVVVYTGDELKGYGNLIIIKHSSGWLTAYAHQREVLVQKGQMVKRGQIIGEVGSTGNVSKPQLHFAIRKGREAQDPLQYLSSG